MVQWAKRRSLSAMQCDKPTQKFNITLLNIIKAPTCAICVQVTNHAKLTDAVSVENPNVTKFEFLCRHLLQAMPCDL